MNTSETLVKRGQNIESELIVSRFLEALEALITVKKIKGTKTFTDKYNIDRSNLNKLKLEPWRNIFQVSWLGHLVSDFGFSAEWFLTGEGRMFKNNKDQEHFEMMKEYGSKYKYRKEKPNHDFSRPFGHRSV
jgi:hypothetical protein